MEVHTLFVVVKLAERCNIKCSYCYYYSPSHADVYDRPVLMPTPTLDRLADFLAETAAFRDLSTLVIAFHGGEPTLMRPAIVDRFASDLRSRLPAKTVLRLAVQTNGVFLPPGWLDIIKKHDIHVGISLDGRKPQHDLHRVDHKGRGTYDRILRNIRMLQETLPNHTAALGAISVLSPDTDVLSLYRHVSEDIGIRRIKLLLPDQTHDTAVASVGHNHDYSAGLSATFDYWMMNHLDLVNVEMFDRVVRSIMLSRARSRLTPKSPSAAIAVLSNGEFRIADEYMVTDQWFKGQLKLSIFSNTFDDWFEQASVKEVWSADHGIPAKCLGCEYATSCAGGEVASRYSSLNGFDNRSVHCQTLWGLHQHISNRLLRAEDVDHAAATA
ncbi:radical SAM protein [Dyella mobilis]|uniref:Radical SAM protein n=1 Tax=Dyella mobilis TaxID=1849582 RepID=A0ABS2KM81_9GAMM|nr:radical SAM protein [Dyella mobilis]MBM7132264.1 radical SAM protein [Dyella mobilis]GLQ95751.1 XyeB family radical SAM/SPASM peptide maturase [Dyella mobilis]